eukprot:scaffold99130_cov42-Prasinocladus_malaysianus.AAC.1
MYSLDSGSKIELSSAVCGIGHTNTSRRLDFLELGIWTKFGLPKGLRTVHLYSYTQWDPLDYGQTEYRICQSTGSFVPYEYRYSITCGVRVDVVRGTSKQRHYYTENHCTCLEIEYYHMLSAHD